MRVSRGRHSKKKQDFSIFILVGFTYNIYSKKSSIRPLSSYIFIYLMDGEGGPECRWFFYFARSAYPARDSGSHSWNASGEFLMPQKDPRR